MPPATKKILKPQIINFNCQQILTIPNRIHILDEFLNMFFLISNSIECLEFSNPLEYINIISSIISSNNTFKELKKIKFTSNFSNNIEKIQKYFNNLVFSAHFSHVTDIEINISQINIVILDFVFQYLPNNKIKKLQVTINQDKKKLNFPVTKLLSQLHLLTNLKEIIINFKTFEWYFPLTKFLNGHVIF